MTRIMPVLAVVLITTAAAWSQPMYEADSQQRDGHRWATVKRLGITMFGIPVGAGGLTPEERAQVIVSQRLNPLLAQGVLDHPERIAVGRMNGEMVVLVSNPEQVAGLPAATLLITIDGNFERFMKRPRADIAAYWRDLMRKYSKRGIMKVPAGELDPAGRELDAGASWYNVPTGYSQTVTTDAQDEWQVPGN